MNLGKERSSLPRILVFPFIILAVFGVISLQRWPQLVLDLASCPLRQMTGLPCPTCGGTHAAVALSHGDWLKAFVENPLAAVFALIFGIWIIYSVIATIVPSLRRSLTLENKEKRATRILIALFVAGTWIWEIVRL